MILDYNSKDYFIGNDFMTNQGYLIKIIGKSNNKNRYFIEFENGVVMETSTSSISNGTIKNPYHLTVFKTGYLGKGKYSDQTTRVARIWRSIIQRCYDKNFQITHPTYLKTKVCKEWHNFQVFAEWYHQNYIEDFDIDKDLLQLNIEEKIYSPETCMFLPRKINSFLSRQGGNKNKFGVVGITSRRGKFSSRIIDFDNGKSLRLGDFDTIDEAADSYNKEYLNQVEKAKNYMRNLNIYEDYVIEFIK